MRCQISVANRLPLRLCTGPTDKHPANGPRSVTVPVCTFTSRWVTLSHFCPGPVGVVPERVGSLPRIIVSDWWPVQRQTVTVIFQQSASSLCQENNHLNQCANVLIFFHFGISARRHRCTASSGRWPCSTSVRSMETFAAELQKENMAGPQLTLIHVRKSAFI